MKSPSAKSKAGKQGLNNQKQGLKVQEQMKTMKLTSAKSKSEKYDAGRVIEKKAGRKAEMMTIKNHGLCGYQWIVQTKFSQVEKSAHPMKVMLETSDFPFFISLCCKTCLDEVIALWRT